MRQIITEREKAIIVYAIRTGKDKTIEDWTELYALSRQAQTEKQAREKIHLSNIYTWRNGEGIKKFYNEQKQIYFDELQRMKEEYAEMILEGRETAQEKEEREKRKTSKGINFQDRDQFLKYLNNQANKIADDKQRLDYLKLIADLQRLKETDSKGNDEIQRFYTSVQCEKCAIYLKAKENQSK